jgi:hypothetical protein
VLHADAVQQPAPPRRARFTDARLRRFREAIGRLREVGHDEQLEQALDECDEAICAYQAGLLDDEELRRELFRAGTVIHDDEAWLLDLVRVCWRQWDGVRLQSIQGA